MCFFYSKFGLAYVGVGWVIFRDRAMLPKELVFEVGTPLF